jgi:hypothetical protein
MQIYRSVSQIQKFENKKPYISRNLSGVCILFREKKPGEYYTTETCFLMPVLVVITVIFLYFSLACTNFSV